MATSEDLSHEVSSALPAPAVGKRRKSLSYINFHVTLGGLLILLVYLFSQSSLADPDIWWHLNFAQQIVTTHQLPTVDTRSFTAAGSAWIDHEWLAEIAYYTADKAFGLHGLFGLYLVLACIIETLILYRAYKLSGDVKNSFIVAVFCVLLIVVSFGPRMLLFGWLYMLVMLIALDRFREGSNKALWVLPPLFCLWINTHGSWLIGLVVFGIILASGLVRINWGMVESDRWTGTQTKQLAITFAASIALLFVNPYGYRLVAYPFDMAFHQALNISHVEEWASVDFHTPRGKVVAILLASVLACALFSSKKWKLHELLLAGLALYSGITYIRFLFLIAILVSPLVAARLRFFPPYDEEKDKPLLNLAFLLVVVGVIVFRFPSNAKLQHTIDEKYPKVALQYLREHNIKDRVLTDYLWGGYVERFYPEMPVFIDSRVDIFEYNGTLKDYLDLTSMKNSLEILDRYKIEYVFFKKSEPLVYLLRNTQKWSILYEDDVAIVLKRTSGLRSTQ